MPIIKDFSELKESEIYSDGLKSYDGLVDFLLRFVLQLCKKVQSYRVKHAKFEFANGRSHINDIENFWGPYKGYIKGFHGKGIFLFTLKGNRI
ncbi:transposase [Campylobacter troglodytis]|uniref:transposase n=1 Tax=Campylobacter troglodytis TaxID=654363 RepID=UPI0011593BBC|nr:transposase [Campylobacter troglodytis]TQR61307.1 hypothetical protein DMC01_01645 [Campylobacter troglodytis]